MRSFKHWTVITMRQIDNIRELRASLRAARLDGKRIGLVPTMGYLHEGHLALVQAARHESDFVVTSVFVNPLQFAPTEDLATYPRNLNRDINLLSDAEQCDIVFAPSVDEMYPSPMETMVSLPEMSKRLCGETRPMHFQGVATVVNKLFNIVQPDIACFGQKDGQQLAIIRHMVKDLNMPVEVIGVPTVRERDGLAKSSRNMYLSDEERNHATVLYQALQWARGEIDAGERSGTILSAGLRERISRDDIARLEYAEAVSLDTLAPMEIMKGPIMLAVAAHFGKARLIDNIQLNLGGE